MSLREIAARTLVLSVLMQDRTKLSTEQLIAHYPNGFTIAQIDSVDDYYVFTIKENNNVFAMTGTALASLFDAWIAANDGSIEDVNSLLIDEDVKIKLEITKTKKGQPFTKAVLV